MTTTTAPPRSKHPNGVIGQVLVLLSLPLVLVLVNAVSFSVANRENGSLISAGQKRKYVLYVPRSYDPTKPTPLVISMHGAGLWGAAQRDMSQWNRVAEAQGFIVVYPSAAKSRWPRVWHVEQADRRGGGGGGGGPIKDVRFIAELIDTLKRTYNVDPARIYADGLSNGGGMAFVLSCTLSDRIAAVGMVASAQTLEWSWCHDQRAVPMIAFHGTADRLTPYHGGTSWIGQRPFPSIPTWTANWARRNGCAPRPMESAVAPDVTRRLYLGCADDATVVLYTVQGGGHSWPGGARLPEWFAGSTSTSVSASSLMWEFFQEHPLRRN